MKRIIALILMITMVLTLAACGKDDDKLANNDTPGGSSVTESTDDKKDTPAASLSIDAVKKAKETDASLFEYTDVDGGVSITGFNGSDEIVVIPTAIDDKEVVSIGKNAFINNSTMKGVKIPEKAHTLENSAFMNCTELEVVVSGAAVKKIDMYVFNGCKKLHAIELNDGLVTLGGLCFALTNLSEIEIPSSVTEINYPFTVNDDKHFITVIAESGSSAEQYVNEKGEEYHLVFQAK